MWIFFWLMISLKKNCAMFHPINFKFCWLWTKTPPLKKKGPQNPHIWGKSGKSGQFIQDITEYYGFLYRNRYYGMLQNITVRNIFPPCSWLTSTYLQPKSKSITFGGKTLKARFNKTNEPPPKIRPGSIFLGPVFQPPRGGVGLFLNYSFCDPFQGKNHKIRHFLAMFFFEGVCFLNVWSGPRGGVLLKGGVLFFGGSYCEGGGGTSSLSSMLL